MEIRISPVLPTDSANYDIITEGVIKSAQANGLTCEIGLRRGGGTKYILDALKSSGQEKLHIAIDPYGNIDYPEGDEGRTIRCDYTNSMRDETLINLYLYCWQNKMPFLFFNLEDSEFFKRYADGVPVYNEHKQLINQYAFVHFDGPHTVSALLDEIAFFHPRSSQGAVWVFDDVALYDHAKIDHHLTESLGWTQYAESPRKWAYVKEN